MSGWAATKLGEWVGLTMLVLTLLHGWLLPDSAVMLLMFPKQASAVFMQCI